MKNPKQLTGKNGQQPIRTRVKQHRGTAQLPNYIGTVRGELPIHLSARVSAVHARSILESDSGVFSKSGEFERIRLHLTFLECRNVVAGIPEGAISRKVGLIWGIPV